MLLCDAADDAGGKLYILGGGWTHVARPNEPLSMALAVLLGIDWDETNEQFRIVAGLVTEDGEVVELGDRPVLAQGELEVGRPPGLKRGSTINAPIAMQFNGLVLPAGGYVWELRVNDDLKARTPFRVVDPPS